MRVACGSIFPQAGWDDDSLSRSGITLPVLFVRLLLKSGSLSSHFYWLRQRSSTGNDPSATFDPSSGINRSVYRRPTKDLLTSMAFLTCDDLFFQLYFQAPTCEIELAPLDWRHNIDHNAVLIFHRYARAAAAHWSLSFNFVVPAVKVIYVL